MERVHFIAVGGSVMHNLALCLARMGYEVSGSDDIIYDPAMTRLKNAGILPDQFGWDSNKIDETVDFIILGMHAKKDNPELLKALDLGIPVYSFPEFVARKSNEKLRIVVAGSHGKTTTTSMIMHGLRRLGLGFDFLVGAQLDGFDVMVQLTDVPIIVIEGDEYLSSAIDSRPKFLHYNPDICVLTGLDWDHINVFPTYEEYLNAFRVLIEDMSESSMLIYNQYDPLVEKFVQDLELKCQVTSYEEGQWTWQKDHWLINLTDESETLHFPGEHNMVNLMSALRVIDRMPASENKRLCLFKDFNLPDKRLNLIYQSPQLEIFRDFAHAPSKVNASVTSMRLQAEKRNLVTVQEIHTYSSLNKEFLPQYKGALDNADKAFLYFNPVNLKIKSLDPIDADFIRQSFDRKDLEVYTDANQLLYAVRQSLSGDDLLLLMSSSNFGGVDWLSLVN